MVGQVFFALVRSQKLESLPPLRSQTLAPAPWNQEGELGTGQSPFLPVTIPCSRCPTALNNEYLGVFLAIKSKKETQQNIVTEEKLGCNDLDNAIPELD